MCEYLTKAQALFGGDMKIDADKLAKNIEEDIAEMHSDPECLTLQYAIGIVGDIQIKVMVTRDTDIVDQDPNEDLFCLST